MQIELKPYQIRARLLEKNIRIKDIAELFNVDPSYISHIISRRKRSPRIEEYISSLIQNFN